MEILLGALIFLAGYLTCFFTVKKTIKRESSFTETKIPRVKPSLRNPLRTYAVKYERYKSRDSDLYAPQKPKRGDIE